MIEKGACVGVWMCGRVTNCFVYLSTMVNINGYGWVCHLSTSWKYIYLEGMCLPGILYLVTQVVK